MAYRYFSHNGQILPSSRAVVPLSNIEYSYGFGVYENVRVTHGKANFMTEHCHRLMESTRIINLGHRFTPEFITESAEALIAKNRVDTCNLKILLVGGHTPETATLDILCLNPRFPDRKLYKQGVHVITKQMERSFPQAKTLNMLPSYLAYREARAAGAYDTLLVNRNGHITEGTGSNFFAIKGTTIFSPPEREILLGVTRDHVLTVARKNGFLIKEKSIGLKNIRQYDGLFLTSTSAKIMPIISIDNIAWPTIPATLQKLMRLFDKTH